MISGKRENAAAGSREQRNSQSRLQCSEELRHGGWGHAECVCRSRDAAKFCGTDEVLDATQSIHVGPPGYLTNS